MIMRGLERPPGRRAMGATHFTGYRDFIYNNITDLWQHKATAVYQVMVLWTLWCQWLELWNVMIEIGCVDAPTVARTWLDECMLRLKNELILRLAEAQSVQQWLIVEEKRALSRV